MGTNRRPCVRRHPPCLSTLPLHPSPHPVVHATGSQPDGGTSQLQIPRRVSVWRAPCPRQTMLTAVLHVVVDNHPPADPTRRSGRPVRAPRTPSPGSRAGRSEPAAAAGNVAEPHVRLPSPWSSQTDRLARTRGSSRTGRPRRDRSSAAQNPATATTAATADARSLA